MRKAAFVGFWMDAVVVLVHVARIQMASAADLNEVHVFMVPIYF